MAESKGDELRPAGQRLFVVFATLGLSDPLLQRELPVETSVGGVRWDRVWGNGGEARQGCYQLFLEAAQKCSFVFLKDGIGLPMVLSHRAN